LLVHVRHLDETAVFTAVYPLIGRASGSVTRWSTVRRGWPRCPMWRPSFT